MREVSVKLSRPSLLTINTLWAGQEAWEEDQKGGRDRKGTGDMIDEENGGGRREGRGTRNTWGSYDALRENVSSLPAAIKRSAPLRECNWVRFLRVESQYSAEVNLVATLTPHNTIVFTVIK
ncbi:hypothetical protein E2C01_087583 [Portunus trituberculatus]|uniref:Uncharacterized protein n=1 Tax=Portunus trituberculatus TaxID=210409 RepID=A0A5B7J8I5_PORTR|nr:hypothetical protein [Portunus trituberculatus]